LILPESTLKKLKTISNSIRNVEVLRKQGYPPLKGALLYGPPGTGKTQVARTLAKESGVAFMSAGPSDIKAGFVGQSVQKVNELFQRARDQAPCILFVDEVDAGVPQRGSAMADQFTTEIVNEFLRQMDGVKKNDRYVFVLAATNEPQLVDDGFLSRFEEKIEVAHPTPEDRRKLFKLFLSKHPSDFDVDEIAAELARRCGDIGGRDIQSLVRRATQLAIQRAFDTNTVDHVVLQRDDVLSQLPPENRAEGASHV
jgi:transitional endoplasmic reticulum ATPase